MLEIKKIKDIAKVRRGASPRPIDDPKYFGGDVGWVRIADVTASNKYLRKTTQYVSPLGESYSVRVNKGDLVITIAGTVGRPIIIDIPACIHDGFVQIYDLEDTEIEYLYYFLKHIEKGLYRFGQSGTQTNLNSEIIKNLELTWLPKPEQTRIAEILSKADESIAHTEALIAKYQRIKTGLMQDLLTRGIDEKGNIRSKTTHKFVKKNGMEVPEEWEVVRLENACSRIGDGVHSSVNFSVEGTIPFLFVSCIKEGEILWKNATTVTDSEFQKIGIGVNDNDDFVLYSVVGSFGNAVKLSGKMKVTFQRHIAYMIPQKAILNSNFLEVFLNSEFGKRQANFFAIGNAQKTITLNALRNYTVLLPQINEQEAILGIIQKEEKAIKDCQNYLTKLNSLKKGLMQDLLSGKVRVKI